MSWKRRLLMLDLDKNEFVVRMVSFAGAKDDIDVVDS